MMLHWIDRVGIGLCFIALAFGISRVGNDVVVVEHCGGAKVVTEATR